MEIEQLLDKARHLPAKEAFSLSDVSTVDALLALMYQGAGGRVQGFSHLDGRSEWHPLRSQNQHLQHGFGASAHGKRIHSRSQVLRSPDPR